VKAARFHGRGDIRVEEVPEPEVRPGTVLVEVEWCGSCGTDRHEYLDGRSSPAGSRWSTSSSRASGS
jgi:(R,R)-butanediol dehydrogenase/meso-butanediol dehydrogenase/diacetyl reductase